MSASSRDEEFSEFVAARQSHLRRIAYAVCGDWHRADDLLQIALVKLYLAWPRIRQTENAEAYARQIIVRTNVSEHRRPWRRERLGLDAAHDKAVPAGLPFEDRSAMFEALQALPVMQRKAVLLRHWLGLSIEETAQELGISVGTVKSHTSRGVHKLQETLTHQ